MNELISKYKDKYFKYKNKYLNLKYGGQSKYRPISLRTFSKNYYVNIRSELILDVYFKDKLVSTLESNGYKLSSKEDASVVFIYGQDRYPKQNEGETSKEFEERKRQHETQFTHIYMINMLYGEFKEIITNKVRFHEYFKYNKIIQKYLIPWVTIKKDSIDKDILKVVFTKDEFKVLKAENGYRSMGTILVNNREEIRNHISFYNNNPLFFNVQQNQALLAKNWIVEDYINQDKIEGRKFFIRVYILVISSSNHFKVYMSNKHPYNIMKKESKNLLLSNEDIDNRVGANLLIKVGAGQNDLIDIDDKKVIYTFEENPYWPRYLPDGYTKDDILHIDLNLRELFINIFGDNELRRLRPDFNSQRGFEMFGCDVSFVNKEVKLHEMNRRTSLLSQAPFIEDIIKIYKEEDNFDNLSRIL